MGSATLVRAEEYLATTFHPDCDYVDSVIEERHGGQKDHSSLQTSLPIWFWARRKELRLKAFVEQRLKVTTTRFRVPDVCVVDLPAPEEQVFHQPPFIVIEVLSPDDTVPKLQERLDDYLSMGVVNLWVLEPASRRAWWITPDGHFEARDGVLRTTDGRVTLPIGELFGLDQ
ncbi:MAG: Uma2 family endonuclease [Acidobacteriota bacterium]